MNLKVNDTFEQYLRHYSADSGEKYSQHKYFWPIFSTKNCTQDADGWFTKFGKKRKKKNTHRNIIY